MRQPTLIGTNRPLLTLCTSPTPHTPHPHEVIHIDRLRPLQPVKRVGEPPNASTLFRGCWGVSRRLLWVTSYCTHFLKSPFECEATDGATNDKGDFLKSL